MIPAWPAPGTVLSFPLEGRKKRWDEESDGFGCSSKQLP